MARNNWILLALAALLYLSILGPGLWPGQTFFARDLTYLWHPWKTLVTESLTIGRLPLWNPYNYGGMPLMANFQSSVFYPGSLLYYIFPFVSALKLTHLTHYTLAAGGMVLLLRKWRLKPAASWTGGLVFGLNGYLLARLEFPNILAATAWFPVALLLLQKKKKMGLGLALLFSWLAGYPPVFLFQVLALCLLLPAAEKGAWATLVGGLFLAGFAGAVQGIPGLELYFQSERAAGLDPAVATAYSFSGKHLAGLLWPELAPRSAAAFTGEKYFWATSCYVGVMAFFLSLLAICHLRQRKQLLLSAGLMLALGLALVGGGNTKVYPLLAKILPIRHPGQLAFLIVFPLAVGSGIGMQFLSHRTKPVIVALALAFLAGELIYHGRGFHPTINDSYFHHRGPLTQWLQQNLRDRRFFLTPRTALHPFATTGASWSDQWLDIRDAQFGLTSAPWHLRNASGSGEPLVLKSFSRFLETLSTTGDWTVLPSLFQKADIAYLLSPEPLPSPPTQLVAKHHWYISALPQSTDNGQQAQAAQDIPFHDWLSRDVFWGILITVASFIFLCFRSLRLLHKSI